MLPRAHGHVARPRRPTLLVSAQLSGSSPEGTGMAINEGAFDRNATNVSIIYYLYLATILLWVTAIVGVIMAFMNRGSGDWLDSHYTYQIRTFWIGILYGFIGVVLTMVVIGIFVLAAVLVWWIVRCLKGLKLIGAKQPIPDPTTWMW
jgi:uncharacterized membrane protein